MENKYWKREGKWDIHRKTGKRKHPLAKKDKYMYRLDRECSNLNRWELNTLLRLKNKMYKDLETIEEKRYFRCSMKIIRDWMGLKIQEEADKWGKDYIPLNVGEDVVIYENNKVFTYDFTEDEDGVIVRNNEGGIENMYYGDENNDTKPKRKSRKEIYDGWENE